LSGTTDERKYPRVGILWEKAMRRVMLGGLVLAASVAWTAGAPSFPGTYKNDSITVEINEAAPGEYAGVFLVGNEVMEFTARRDGNALVGTRTATGETARFRMTLQGATLTVSDEEASYMLQRQGAPASTVPAAAVPPAARQPPPARQSAPGVSAPSAPNPLRINRAVIAETTVRAFERTYGMHLPRGDYWYDRVSGAWGADGGPTAGFTSPGMNLGGELPADASRGNTGVFINGRELPLQDVVGLMQMNVPVRQGRWWVDNSGNFGVEGAPFPLGNLFQYSRGRGGAYQRATAGGYIGGDGNTSYFFDPSTGASVMTEN
jgi:hypothetical protein